VFIWFAVVSVVAVALVFRSTAMDMRLVAAGAILPVVEGMLGGPGILHTLLCGVVLLVGVMLIGRGRRMVQRRWLGVPIGLLSHLALDGTWTDTGLFWWPFAGADVLGDASVSDFDRGRVGLMLEVAGIGLGIWAWKRFNLDRPEARRSLLRHGRLKA